MLAEPDLEHDPCFRMPALGQHYLGKKGQQSEVEQQQKIEAEIFGGMDDNDEEAYMSKVMTTSSGRVVGGKRKAAEPPGPPGGWASSAPTDDASSGPSPLVTAKMVMRLLACFIQQDGVPSKHEEDAQEMRTSLLDGPDMLRLRLVWGLGFRGRGLGQDMLRRRLG